MTQVSQIHCNNFFSFIYILLQCLWCSTAVFQNLNLSSFSLKMDAIQNDTPCTQPLLNVTIFIGLCYRADENFVSLGACVDFYLGMKSGTIPDSDITASSVQSANTPAKNGRLSYISGSSWCAGTGDTNPYLQIDLKTLHIVCAVSTQGNSKADQWVKTYKLQLSTDGTTWTDYTESGGQAKVCHMGWLRIIWYLASITVPEFW